MSALHNPATHRARRPAALALSPDAEPFHARLDRCPRLLVSAFAATIVIVIAISIVGTAPASAASTDPNPSALRYQGRLTETNGLVNGRFDFRFALFASADASTPLGPALTNSQVEVDHGLFTTELRFAPDLFTAAGAWLEIAVRPAATDGAFVPLTPRQRLGPVPSALHARRADALTGPLPAEQWPAGVARLDRDLAFAGQAQFASNVQVAATLTAGALAGDGAGLSNVSATAVALSARLAERLWRISIPFVTVTNAGNPPDPETGKGSVPYAYRIGRYEITYRQYVAFLNAIAAEDPNDLYDTNMTTDVHGGILRTGNPGDFHYSVKPGFEHHPVVWVDFADILRFCNWLHHGQPVGRQSADTTEDGAYTMNPDTVWGNTIRRNPGARFWIPSDNEWYKAAYYQPADRGGDTSGYWTYPNRSHEPPFAELPPGFDSNSANACCETGRQATDVGAYRKSFSFYGTFDQAGNVEEWTEEIVYTTNRRLRGGSWTYNEFYSKKTDFEFDTPDYEADGIGFRVAGVAE